MELKTPQSLKSEHEELHVTLNNATKLTGKTGEAAKELAELMHPHFEKEEKFVLPPLALIATVANGKINSEMKEVLELTDRLKAELPDMILEHAEIRKSAEKLKEHAAAENHKDVVEFVEKLILHAQTEEELTYPAALLVGEVIRQKLAVPYSEEEILL